MPRRKEYPQHEYTEGVRCYTAAKECFAAVFLKWGTDGGREDACKWCKRCFWCSALDGCHKAPRTKEEVGQDVGVH